MVRPEDDAEEVERMASLVRFARLLGLEDSLRRREDSAVIAECPSCDDRGIATSAVTGARGVCRHPTVDYHGHKPEEADHGARFATRRDDRSRARDGAASGRTNAGEGVQ